MLPRDRAIIEVAIRAIQHPSFKVLLPFLQRESSWDGLLAPVNLVREASQIKGWSCILYAFSLVFMEVCGSGEQCIPGLYGVFENCLLSEKVFHELLLKVKQPGVPRLVKKGESARDSVSGFVGGLCKETRLNKVVPWIRNLYLPVIRVVLPVYFSFRPSKKARMNEMGPTYAAELRILERLHKLQKAQEHAKRKSSEKVKADALDTTLSIPSSSDRSLARAEDDQAASNTSAPVSSSQSLSTAGLEPVLTICDASTSTPVLLEAFSPKPKSLRSGENLSYTHLADDMPPPIFTLPPRSPLTPRNSVGAAVDLASLFSGDSPAGWRPSPTARPSPPAPNPSPSLSEFINFDW
ncbi:hypothetical protein B0H17DRAFT_1071334 [Mycena rosella]|uniref:Uncharacterized protein n=1 Tax=Mycena rosella TaxID=1033263 RepID=A0AAD7DC03_MYCRO|nr:hypothetical protein B0H17DRAFT_1071334 [Mycena rosella]